MNKLADVAAASACLLYNALPEILKCDPPEAYRRLVQHLETTIQSYLEAANNWGFNPSEN